MKNTIIKTYRLDEILDLYTNVNGVSELFKVGDLTEVISERNEALSPNILPDELFDEEEIDKQIEKDFLDDFEVPENENVVTYSMRIKRYQKIVKKLKQKYNNRCQICGYSFLMDNGNNYCEAHHLKMLSYDGSQSPENVIIVCANHHRIFHYASQNITIGELVYGKRTIKIRKEEYVIQFNLEKFVY